MPYPHNVEYARAEVDDKALALKLRRAPLEVRRAIDRERERRGLSVLPWPKPAAKPAAAAAAARVAPSRAPARAPTAAAPTPQRRKCVQSIQGIVGGLATPCRHTHDNEELHELFSYNCLQSWCDAMQAGAGVLVTLAHGGPVVGLITRFTGEMSAHRIHGLQFRLDLPGEMTTSTQGWAVSPQFRSTRVSYRQVGQRRTRVIEAATLDHLALIAVRSQAYYPLSDANVCAPNPVALARLKREQGFEVYRGMVARGWDWWSAK